jgi:hypothetical protein
VSQAPVVHICNPSYSGSKDWEDQGLKPAQASSSWDPISKNPTQKRTGKVAQGVGPEFKPQYWKKQKIRDDGAILALPNQVLQVHGTQESGDTINFPGESDAANPAPLHQLVFGKSSLHFGYKDTEIQIKNVADKKGTRTHFVPTCPPLHFLV